MNKFCRNCGKELTEGQNVCLNCGVFVNNKPNTQMNPDKQANIGLILSLISIIAWIIPLFGFPVTICAIVYSSKGLSSDNEKTKATISLVLAIIFLSLTLINSIVGAVMGANGYFL